jgi:4'-phosphopantetheinyl transferase EntD
MWDAQPVPEEAKAISNALTKRQQEFAAGRACAHEALASFGIHDFPLINDSDGVPVWPKGIVGSVAHCSGYCAVAIARNDQLLGLGLDVEPILPLEEELRCTICSERERHWIENEAPPNSFDWYKLFFCAKESSFKAVYPIMRVSFDFWTIEVSLCTRSGEFGAKLPFTGNPFDSRLAGRYGASAQHVVAAAVLRFA